MSKKGLDIQIIVATHKKYKMPEDNMYLPLHVGSEGKESLGYTKDNTGDNISTKNPYYCELTGLYWAWKNIKADYIGLVHYRRYFSLKLDKGNDFDLVLTRQQIQKFLPEVKIFVPKKRKYYIETLYSHYAHTHYSSHLEETRKVVEKLYPSYVDSFDKVMKHTYGYMFNMMIMRGDYFNSYCEWLFPILFELENRIGKENEILSSYQGRLYGRVSEIIFNVWLDKQLSDCNIKKSEIKELPFVYMEKINWKKKFISFFKAKFFKKKYDGSF